MYVDNYPIQVFTSGQFYLQSLNQNSFVFLENILVKENVKIGLLFVCGRHMGSNFGQAELLQLVQMLSKNDYGNSNM